MGYTILFELSEN